MCEVAEWHTASGKAECNIEDRKEKRLGNAAEQPLGISLCEKNAVRGTLDNNHGAEKPN